ncbi:MAG: hypothetical protein IJ733_18290 [Lachnospiraceae bacterium]|nr:hypothetical protein [Lachnospiraceae bacterium]
MEQIIAGLLFFILIFGGWIGLFVKWLIHRKSLEKIRSKRYKNMVSHKA